MKKKILFSCLVVVVIIASLYLGFRETFDRFNPLIDQEYVYVEVQDEPTDDNGRYKYREQGVTESGETKRVVFTASTRLEQGTLLKVLSKGTYTVEYKFINEDEMP
ncbi:YxeA family protein [Virgibacillus sp. YIM 98842]|uniref:YxeA family protein n=1 Tax=Virgibacillus sp. YIM 98842 TaxID=2663533 RepID=UPI0013DBBE2B|nr:YxeA family protein [Virgibacillus sp. YIM 98842]